MEVAPWWYKWGGVIYTQRCCIRALQMRKYNNQNTPSSSAGDKTTAFSSKEKKSKLSFKFKTNINLSKVQFYLLKKNIKQN